MILLVVVVCRQNSAVSHISVYGGRSRGGGGD
jgi:hypothetical protein